MRADCDGVVDRAGEWVAMYVYHKNGAHVGSERVCWRYTMLGEHCWRDVLVMEV